MIFDLTLRRAHAKRLAAAPGEVTFDGADDHVSPLVKKWI
jgi:hypothetical protein